MSKLVRLKSQLAHLHIMHDKTSHDLYSPEKLLMDLIQISIANEEQKIGVRK